MLGKGSVCDTNPGYFKLQDTVCELCAPSHFLKKGRIARIYGFSPFWCWIFLVGFGLHIAAIFLYFTTVEQVVFSSALMFAAFVSFWASYLNGAVGCLSLSSVLSSLIQDTTFSFE